MTTSAQHTPDRSTGPDPSAAPEKQDVSTSQGTDASDRLFADQRAQEYGARWESVKACFVDEPRQAVGQADQLVSEVLDELQELFHTQRQSLEKGLDNEQTTTEDLRNALHRYRSFFDRLLSV